MATEQTKHTFNISRVAIELVPDKMSRNAYVAATAIGVGLLGLSAYFVTRLPGRIPLLLTLPWGENRLVAKIWLFGIGGMVLVVVSLNILLAKLWREGGSLVPRILSISSIVFAIGAVVATWGVVQSFFL